MIKAEANAVNLLHRDSRTSLVVVRVDPRGNPDCISYWKNTGRFRIKHHEAVYKVGALVDIWA